MKFFAHSLEGDPNPEHWQELEDHLKGVARLSAQFSEAFGSAEWGYLAGILHDLGKYQPGFQQKLQGERVSVDHSGIGAAKAIQLDKEIGFPLAFVTAGHHAGLANLVVGGNGLPSPLKERLKSSAPWLPAVLENIPSEFLPESIPHLPDFLRAGDAEVQRARCCMEFWIRFLFSALVDADRLDTEAFCQPERANLRGRYASVLALSDMLDDFIQAKVDNLAPEDKKVSVNAARALVWDACQESSSHQPGIFSLTVPTGGGKTLSAMSFALRHARKHGLRRVIVVIPYTSIIEQNADVYRQALGPENVIEHHSNLDPVSEEAAYGVETTRKNALAAENWDAPVIVTTSVQFFESLFSSRPSRCRKLHNIARSVIILDEVQTLPPAFLLSILDAVNELCTHYGCSVVLSTATPPALAKRERFEVGFAGVREIIPDSKSLAEQLRRVEYNWPNLNSSIPDWPELAVELAAHTQIMAVVHKRIDARILARHVEQITTPESVWHLSALMCPAHRSTVLGRVKEPLMSGKPCRLITTQLVEAGVDIDFPIVYRALGGLDSVVQAAGRCNREGRLKEGRVVVFRAPTNPPKGTPMRGLEVTESLLRETGGLLDPNDPQIFETYFRKLYFSENQDSRQIQTLRQEFNFATVSREFKLIEDGFTRSVIVPYGEANRRLDDLRRLGPNRETLRGLQRFIVNIYPDAFSKLLEAGALEQVKAGFKQEVVEGIWVLSPGFEKLYDQKYGLVVGDDPMADPKALII
jgi:CRISPR-associated endonuclease/helicase Cas3